VISAQPSAASRQRGRDAGGQPGLRLRWAFLVALAGGLLLAVSFPPRLAPAKYPAPMPHAVRLHAKGQRDPLAGPTFQ